MEKKPFGRLSSLLLDPAARQPRKQMLNPSEDEISPLRAAAIEDIRRAHAEMKADQHLLVRPPCLSVHANRNPRLHRTAEEMAHYAVSVAAAEAGLIDN